MTELLAAWGTALALDTGRYFVVAGVAFVVFWRWGRGRFRRRLVHGVFATTTDMRREVRYSASTILVFSLVGVALVYGTRAGIFRIYDAIDERGWLYFALTIVLLPILHDMYFYWTHRAMHHPRLYRHVHRVHHLSTNPSPWTAYAFAPAEAIVHALFVPIVVTIVPVHIASLFVFLFFMIVRNVIGHLGIELLPRGFTRSPWLAWSTTTTHHCMHHRRVGANFGLYFTWWDRAMRTTDAAYEQTFERVTTAR
jgi:sterol desaturase/sphingolipid hydroxylase (fatty acid hydroxylase superfamily)